MIPGKAHLVVIKGDDVGREFDVRGDGVRIGRSSRNDVVLKDPLLSRHHCRVFFKSDGTLWIADLGSSNKTYVRGEPIQECMLTVGDEITLGNTVIKVTQIAQEDSAGEADERQKRKTGPIDLGLSQEEVVEKKPATAMRLSRFIRVLVFIIAVAGAMLLILILTSPRGRTARKPPAPPPPPLYKQGMELDYEKVEADGTNIFRYHLLLSRDNVLSVEIDDIQNNRHVRREKQVDSKFVEELAKLFCDKDFFSLREEYYGVSQVGYYQWQILATLGRRAHRVRVVNRLEPDKFKEIREGIEVFAKTELGLLAMQFPVEQLIKMAHESFLMGKKLYEEREVKYGNLAQAIKFFRSVGYDLETIEPKPDFYAESVSELKKCEEELEQKYNDLNFRADRAIKLREWQEAANCLKIICELIPDNTDPRHKEAREKLLVVEGRIREKSK
jgi:hypothetical protein